MPSGIRTRTSGIMVNVAMLPSVTAAVATFTGPGDIISGATGWWGLRAYTAASIGSSIIRLREDGGNTESDFATIAGGGLDLSAISTFKGANNLFVVKLYDQTGGGNHAVQATAANQPRFNLSALGSLPAMQCISSTPLYLLAPAGGPGSQPYTISAVAQSAATGLGAVIGGFDSQNGVLRMTNANITVFTDIGTTFSVADSASTWYAVEALANGASSALYVNGTNTGGLAGGASAFGVNRVAVGNESVFGGSDNLIQECGYWTGDQSAFFASLNTNQRNYYGF